MITHTRLSLFLLLMAAAITAAGCDDPNDDDDAGDQEFITRVIIRFEPVGAGTPITLTWSDPDGDGTGDFTGAANLKAGTTYNATLELYNDLAEDEDEQDVTAEIAEEAEAHQFFYTPSASLQPYVTVTITDRDGRNLPVGLEFDLVTASLPAGTDSVTGTLNIALNHYSSIVKNGTARGNEEDINITAPVSVTR